jgi:LysR family transcriptional regulator, transcriptional activator of the cysJI operon
VSLENLRLIRDVAHQKSVSKAARLHEISQSAASQQIQEVEREFGVSFFDRRTRPLTVTPAGKLFLDYCRDVLRREDELKASLDAWKAEARGAVRVASIYSVALSEMAEIEREFAARFPEVSLEVSYLRPERVFEAVERDEADLGLVSYAESSKDVIALPWREEEMVVAVSPWHRLASRHSIPVPALEGESFIGFDDHLPIQDHIDRFLRDHKVEVNITLRFDNMQMIKEAVAHNAGISIIPRRVMKTEIAQGRMTALRLQSAKLFRPVRIIHRRRKVFTRAASGLLTLLQKNQSHAAA